jgi:hypothetical protein
MRMVRGLSGVLLLVLAKLIGWLGPGWGISLDASAGYGGNTPVVFA